MLDADSEALDAYEAIGNASIYWLPSDGSTAVTGTGVLDATDVETHGDQALSARFVLRLHAAAFDGIGAGECLTVTNAEPAVLEAEYRIVAPPQRLNDGAELKMFLETL